MKLEICKRTMGYNHSYYYIAINGTGIESSICYTEEEIEIQYNRYKNAIIENDKGKTEIIKLERL